MFSIRIIENLEEAKKMWEELSPHSNIYEDWDFRYLFSKYFVCPLRFYAGEEDGKPVALLPLEYNEEKGHLEFFGGTFMEDNHAFVKPGYEKHIPELYAAVRGKAKLEDIVIDNGFLDMRFQENKYIIELDGLDSLDDYLEKTFSAKTRKGIRRHNAEVDELEPKIAFNEPSDLDALIELNRRAFGDESSFNKPHRREIYEDILKQFQTLTISATIDGMKQNVSLAILYQGTFVSLAIGNNKDDYPNLGHYMFQRRVEKAIGLGCKTFDAGLGSLGWKDHWHLKKIPEYKYVVRA